MIFYSHICVKHYSKERQCVMVTLYLGDFHYTTSLINIMSGKKCKEGNGVHLQMKNYYCAIAI